jgi:DNA-binding winged helix-turn-helix (wHTH) protein
VPQDQLVREVWGPAYDENFEGLRVYIYRLRQKLEMDPDDPRYLVTFPGVGYMVRAPEAPGPRPKTLPTDTSGGRGPGPSLSPEVRPTATCAKDGLSAELPVGCAR